MSTEVYRKEQRNTLFEIGEFVMIERKPNINEGGWSGEWYSTMNIFNIGYPINHIHDDYGIELHMEGAYHWFPYFVLSYARKFPKITKIDMSIINKIANIFEWHKLPFVTLKTLAKNIGITYVPIKNYYYMSEKKSHIISLIEEEGTVNIDYPETEVQKMKEVLIDSIAKSISSSNYLQNIYFEYEEKIKTLKTKKKAAPLYQELQTALANTYSDSVFLGSYNIKDLYYLPSNQHLLSMEQSGSVSLVYIYDTLKIVKEFKRAFHLAQQLNFVS